MSTTLVAEELSGNLNQLSEFDNQISNGVAVEVRIYLDRDLSQNKIEEIESGLCEEQIELLDPIRQDARIMLIRFRKGPDSLEKIASTVSIASVSVLGWQLFRDDGNSIYPVLLISAVIGLAIYIGRKKCPGTK